VSVATASFVLIVLFMVHEFEEIVLVRRWIAVATPDHPNDIWVKGRDHYVSAEAIAVAIAEEFVLLAVILGVAIGLDAPEIVLALSIVNALHLVVHLIWALRARRWTPGSPTALATLPGIVALMVALMMSWTMSIPTVAAWMLGLGALAGSNLKAMWWAMPRFDRWAQRTYCQQGRSRRRGDRSTVGPNRESGPRCDRVM
jgi:hypothetical protein